MARRCDNQNNTANNTDHNLNTPDHASKREMDGMRELARPIRQDREDYSLRPHLPSNVDHLGKGDD